MSKAEVVIFLMALVIIGSGSIMIFLFIKLGRIMSGVNKGLNGLDSWIEGDPGGDEPPEEEFDNWYAEEVDFESCMEYCKLTEQDYGEWCFHNAKPQDDPDSMEAFIESHESDLLEYWKEYVWEK